MDIIGSERILNFDHTAYKKIIIDNPREIVFRNKSYKGVNGEIMKNWIKRHSDTSITVSENNKFYSQGSQIGFAEQVYLSSDMTMFIEIDNQLYIDSMFHHDRDWHLWTYDKLGIKDILVGIKQLEENTLSKKTYLKHRREKQHSMIINTRWSATNYFHWIIEAVPRLKMVKDYFREDIESIEMIWLSDSKPLSYHKETLKNMGIKIDTYIPTSKFPLLFNNLIVASFKDAGSISAEQIHEAQSAYSQEEAVGTYSRYKNENILLLRKSEVRKLQISSKTKKILDDLNFKTVYTEMLNMEEQKELFKNIGILISAHGAGLTNLINMNKNAKLIEIMPSNSIHPIYWYLSDFKRIKYAMIPTKIKNKYQLMEPDCAELEENIKNML